MSFQDRLETLLAGSGIKRNLGRKELIQACVDNGEAFVSKCGALRRGHPRNPRGAVLWIR